MEEGVSVMVQVKVKICGLTQPSEAELLNRYGADYAGVVLFYPKSRRNMTIEEAKRIVDILNPDIRKIAVTVSPTAEQVRVCKEAGFDYIQVHGECREEILEQELLPVFLAANIEKCVEPVREHEHIAGYVFDGKLPGHGEVFDWQLLKSFDRKGKLMMLAGGLQASNVAEAIRYLQPDIVDVSSGVENKNGIGKNADKIREFMECVRQSTQNLKR